jgi:hypothetical protein
MWISQASGIVPRAAHEKLKSVQKYLYLSIYLKPILSPDKTLCFTVMEGQIRVFENRTMRI